MRLSLLAAILGAVAGWACTDSGNPPPPNFGSGSDGSGTTSSSSGSGGDGGSSAGSGGGASLAGAAGEASSESGGSGGTESQGGNAGSGGRGETTTSSTDGPPVFPEVDECPSDLLEEPPEFDTTCALEPSLGDGQALSLGDTARQQLIAITPDELTVVWFSPGGSVGQVLVADRDAPDGDFSGAIGIPDNSVTVRNVYAISPDGLRLVASEQGVQLTTLSRASRGDEFGEAEEGEFAELNAHADENALLFGSAVISPDDETLYYTVTGFEDDEFPIYVSERSGQEAWPVGTQLSTCEFKAYGALMRTPTGVSADGLTLFFDDPAVGGARAAFRETTGAAFEWFVDLGPIGRAQPNSACDQLYYWDTEASNVSVADF